MKRFFYILIIFCTFTTKVQSNQITLRWCAYYNWSPYIYHTSENSWDGILIDELKLFAKDHNIKVIPAKNVPNWKRCQKEVENGEKIDFILGINWTHERSELFNYIGRIDGGEKDTPAFINKSSVGAYALKKNMMISRVNSLKNLKMFELVMIRGNSFGKKIDNFILKLKKSKIKIATDHQNMLKKIIGKRGEYFFELDSNFDSLIKNNQDKISGLRTNLFKKILTVERKTPAYIAFSKNFQQFRKTKNLWLQTIKKYHKSVDFNKELERHKANSKKYTQQP